MHVGAHETGEPTAGALMQETVSTSRNRNEAR